MNDFDYGSLPEHRHSKDFVAGLLRTKPTLELALEYLYGAVPANSWGLLDREADNERRGVVDRLQSLLDEIERESANYR